MDNNNPNENNFTQAPNINTVPNPEPPKKKSKKKLIIGGIIAFVIIGAVGSNSDKSGSAKDTSDVLTEISKNDNSFVLEQNIRLDEFDFKYTGDWKNGLPNGHGTAIARYDDGITIYICDWVNGKANNICEKIDFWKQEQFVQYKEGYIKEHAFTNDLNILSLSTDANTPAFVYIRGNDDEEEKVIKKGYALWKEENITVGCFPTELGIPFYNGADFVPMNYNNIEISYDDMKWDYIGPFIMGHPEGFGYMETTDSDKSCGYIGLFNSGNPDGNGMLLLNSDKSFYHGSFKDGAMDGYGRFVSYEDNTVKISTGNWSGNQRSGSFFRREYYSNGDYIISMANYKANSVDGYRMYVKYNSSGKIIEEGRFENKEYISMNSFENSTQEQMINEIKKRSLEWENDYESIIAKTIFKNGWCKDINLFFINTLKQIEAKYE